jgi:cytochrome c oxidase cbb3-type subunit 2
MKSLPILICLTLTINFALAAAAQNRESKLVRDVLPAIAKAPAEALAWKNPYEGQPDAVLAGEKLFRQHCAECHGEDARGRGRAANLRSPSVQNATPGELAWFLRNGNLRKGMPSWSGLPVQRQWQIVTYLKSLH